MMFYPDSIELFLAYPWLWSRPHDIEVYDATGRRLTNVLAFNPETGEVIRYQAGGDRSRINLTTRVIFDNPLWRRAWREDAYYFLGIPCLKVSYDRLAIDVWRRHGFWPAPLRVVPLGGPVPAGVPYRVGDGAREQHVDITAAEIYARARAKEQRVDFAEAPRPAEPEALKGAMERANKLMAGLALPDELINPVEGEE